MSDTSTLSPSQAELLVERITSEGPLTFSELARRCGGHPSKYFRWHRPGIKLADGTRLHLEVVRFVDGWRTSEAAVRRLLARITQVAVADAAANESRARRVRSPRQRQAANRRARRQLQSAGV
jgi:hypothetical protein